MHGNLLKQVFGEKFDRLAKFVSLYSVFLRAYGIRACWVVGGGPLVGWLKTQKWKLWNMKEDQKYKVGKRGKTYYGKPNIALKLILTNHVSRIIVKDVFLCLLSNVKHYVYAFSFWIFLHFFTHTRYLTIDTYTKSVTGI